MYQNCGKNAFNYINFHRLFIIWFGIFSWFAEMEHAFNTSGKAKTFKKFVNLKPEFDKLPLLRIKQLKLESQAKDDGTNSIETDIDSDATEIIIEPYEDVPSEIEELSSEVEEVLSEVHVSNTTSTELFLKSIQDILERLTDQQNLSARIKIQEVLYNVMYGD